LDLLGPPELRPAVLDAPAPRVLGVHREERVDVGDARDVALRIVGAPAQRWIGFAAPDRVVVLGVAAARGAVADVDEPAAVAEQHDAARRLDRAGRPRIFFARAGVDLA